MDNFNFNSQICTNKEQSEYLLNVINLKPETADMRLIPYTDFAVPMGYNDGFFLENADYTPAWSLHRLLCLIPKEYRYDIDASQFFVDAMICSDPYTETIELIRLLLEDGYIYDEYLNV